MSEQLKIGLVLGAGGPTGGPFIHAALDELERMTGWQRSSASTVLGTSAGAFVAASLEAATSPDPVAIDKLTALANVHTFGVSSLLGPIAALRALAGRLVALVAPTRREIAEYRVAAAPYHPEASVVTVEHRSGRRRLHNLAQAADPVAVVRASAAIPGLNGPVKVGRRRHIDGAVHSANNLDVLDADEHPFVVVISPMIPRSGGALTSRFHRAQLFRELQPWMTPGRSAVVIMPTDLAHDQRRERDPFAAEGTSAVRRLVQ